ncbi:hypothetical protein ACLK1S_05880 [Escherichia coli]
MSALWIGLEKGFTNKGVIHELLDSGVQTGGVLCASSDQKGIDLRQKKRKRSPNLFGQFCSFFALNRRK